MLNIGDKAPNFTLKNQNDEDICLSDFDKDTYVVLYFYPKAMTPGCTTQACGLRDIQAELKAENICVLGVSNDPVARLKKFEERDGLNFTLLSDESLDMIKSYNAWQLKKFMGKEYMGIVRMTYIIKEGNIVQIMPKVKTKTHHDDVLNWVKEN